MGNERLPRQNPVVIDKQPKTQSKKKSHHMLFMFHDILTNLLYLPAYLPGTYPMDTNTEDSG